MQIEPSYISCGIKQIFALDHHQWAAALKSIKNRIYATCDCAWCVDTLARRRTSGQPVNPSARFFIFSDPDEVGNGLRFAKYLKDNSLGNLIEVCVGKNPNTGNNIRLWSWEPPSMQDFDAFMAKAG